MHKTIERFTPGMVDGVAVEAYDLYGGQTHIRVITYGATLNQVWRPAGDGTVADIVLGYDHPQSYATNRGNAGATCGRHANRLAGARFALGNRVFNLPANDGDNHLHGGPHGFGKRVWAAAPDAENNAVHFEMDSPDGDQGYPGHLKARVTYRVDDAGDLIIVMRASSDAETIVNLVHHGYWNLAGHNSGDVLGQHLRVYADRYTPVDATKIPLGTRVDLSGTPFDFIAAKAIGRDIAAAWPGGGYDHNLCIAGANGEMRLCAEAFDPLSGRALAISSNQPGLQFYTANHFGQFPAIGKGGVEYNRYAGFALETQGFPNAPNVLGFPATTLRPDQTYHHEIRVHFSTLDRL